VKGLLKIAASGCGPVKVVMTDLLDDVEIPMDSTGTFVELCLLDHVDGVGYSFDEDVTRQEAKLVVDESFIESYES